MSAAPTRTRVRLAELIAMISLGTDLGMGQPMEHVLRQSLIALRLAERLGLDEETRGVVYYVSLLAWVGCHVDAYEQAKWFGDDLALKADTRQRGHGERARQGAHPEPPRRRPQPAGAGAPGRQVRRRRAAAQRGDRESLAGDQRAGRRARAWPRRCATCLYSDVRALGRQGRAGGGQGRGDRCCRRAWSTSPTSSRSSTGPAGWTPRSRSPGSAAAPSSTRRWWTCSARRRRGCSAASTR